MANVTYKLWCLIKGTSTVFSVTPSGDTTIDDLKTLIWDRVKNGTLKGTDAVDLTLWKMESE
jgi:hypothetical protein